MGGLASKLRRDRKRQSERDRMHAGKGVKLLAQLIVRRAVEIVKQGARKEKP